MQHKVSIKCPKSWHHQPSVQSSSCYLTLTLCMPSHNLTDMFPSSSQLSWWNICSIVNAFIVASRSQGRIAVKFIDLIFEWHDSSFLFWLIWQCEANSMLYLESIKNGHHQCFLSFFIPSFRLRLLVLSETIHLCHQDRSFLGLCQSLFFLWGCGSTMTPTIPFTSH